MSEPTFCYWSVADGTYADMMSTCVRSARTVGVKNDFHVFTDGTVFDATCHNPGDFDKSHFLFKFEFLKEMGKLDYDYFVFIDSDNYFVRHPGNLIEQTQRSPLHVVMESDCAAENNTRGDWWECPLDDYVRLMRASGVQSRSVFNTNAGFWIVHRYAIDQMVDLAMEFWHYAKGQGFTFTEEAPLAYVGHMMMGNPYQHTLQANPDVWASDWTGHFAGRIPDGSAWNFVDYMSGIPIRVNPAIVHCMRSKQAMINMEIELRSGP